MICFYCGKEIPEGVRQIEWKGYPPELKIPFHPHCLVNQVLKMRQAINELRKEGWV